MTDGRDAALIQWFPDLPRGIAELGGKSGTSARNNEERHSARGQSSYSSWVLLKASGNLSNSLVEFLREAGAKAEMVGGLYNQVKKDAYSYRHENVLSWV